MSVIRAYALPHPPMAVPGIGRDEKERIKATLAAFDEASREIASLAPDTIVFITPHNVMYSDYVHISPGSGTEGNFARFNARNIRFRVSYDEELAAEIAVRANASGIPAGGQGERDTSLDHGVMVPMWFIDRRYTGYRAVRVSQSGLGLSAHYRLGQCIAEAAEALGRGTVLVASGDLSHKLSDDGPYGYVPEGAVFDNAIAEVFASGDFLKLLNIPETLRERAAECGYNSFAVLAGCFDRRAVTARLLSYEGPFGVGYAVASFAPGNADASRNILERYEEASLAEARERQGSEDAYRSLARRSLEHTVTHGGTLSLPDDLPEELTKRRAGVFVSLHKHGRLRGCIGTIAPTEDCVAQEIIRNAVSAGLSDTRFDPVDVSELPLLTYKVDVLSLPEPVSGPEELDVRRYGVIVTHGRRRGLLLPNLDGIDTVEEQIAIARQKGGIPANAALQMERFEVTRHE